LRGATAAAAATAVAGGLALKFCPFSSSSGLLCLFFSFGAPEPTLESDAALAVRLLPPSPKPSSDSSRSASSFLALPSTGETLPEREPLLSATRRGFSFSPPTELAQDTVGGALYCWCSAAGTGTGATDAVWYGCGWGTAGAKTDAGRYDGCGGGSWVE
jgi:hypothetical protein